MSEPVTKRPGEVLDYCSQCGTEILFDQLVIKFGKELLCSSDCLCEWVGAEEVTVQAEHENDPTD